MKTLKLLTAAIAITALCSCNGCPVPGWLKKITCKQPSAAVCQNAAKNTPEKAGFSGVVVETLNTAGYTYASVVSGSDTLWAVAPTPAANVKKGDSVTFSADMPMENYLSKTLNRTFKLVYFTGAIQIKGNGALNQIKTTTAIPAGHGATTKDSTAAVGNIVLIEGTLNKDKNLGQGYQYPLIIEDATVRLEK